VYFTPRIVGLSWPFQGGRGFGPARSCFEVLAMIAEPKSTDKIASRMLARYGVRFIWDTHVAAAAAYGLGQLSIAADLTEIAEAAEQHWLETMNELGPAHPLSR
jgi:hypothetical protein